jgi:HEAT repeat protein
MTALCPACWRVVPSDATRCPHCGADIERLHRREFREKLLGALSHPDRDTVIRAALTLAARHDPAASDAIEAAIRRFAREPHVVAGLLDALTHIADDEARRIAVEALGHPSFMVRRAAAEFLRRIGQKDGGPGCSPDEP